MKQTLEYLESFAVMALIVVGLTGAAYHLFREGGGIETAGGSLFAFITNSPLMALAVIVCAAILAYVWHQSRKFQRQNAKAATLVFYLMLASGAYFLERLVFVGTL